MDYQHVTCDLDGSCLIVTLNRPEKLNAYIGQIGAEIAHAFERADSDDNVRAVPSFPGKVSADMPSRYPWGKASERVPAR